jgi:NAD(P)-dependent dehydrogenase (short-subunit alcohol dehydrogenase family)
MQEQMVMDLERQTVVVAGGSSGVGLEVVRRASARGARVVAAARDGKKLAAALEGLGGLASGAAVDATDRSALDGFFADVGVFDHLVLTLSGGEGAGPFGQLDLQALRRGFEAKFWPQLQTAQAALPMLRPGGSITFVTAVSARIARPGVAGLGAINGAIEAMVGTLARELAPSRVNAVSPGVIDTAWWSRLPAEARADIFEEQARSLPVGRVGRAGDVAHAVMFLVENGFVTGTVVECDGGLHLL